ncbi:GGDEF domain-containing protein [Nocardioides sp. BP30]|uniref:GGDEF domain-containing protein n=1 Tax=Nocardioides sp. BP30 TaxID=3036374 RepID=UPI002468309A|nr:GGDEF domain-containing protein [Nocardioides sp. BP30]WGL51509.1 GGDEF domain-containing protein [Nocardioides sp. BP30]
MSLGPIDVFLIAAFFAVLCLGALMSLARAGLPGIRLAVAANALAFVSVSVLWAMLRWHWSMTPALLVGNGVIVAAVLLLYVALCRLSDRPVPVRLLAIGTPVAVLGYLAELLVWPSMTARIVLVSVAHVVLMTSLVRVVWPAAPSDRLGYGRWFSIVALLFEIALQSTRALVYATGLREVRDLGDPDPWNTAFLALNGLGLAALILGVVLVGNDRLVAERAREADTDFLTGVLTPRGWHRRLSALRSTGGGDLGILLLDLDHFKDVNDRHGHAAGDAVLRHFVDILRSVAGSGGVIGRLGGEEFAVTIPGSVPGRVQQVGQSTLCLLHHQPLAYEEASISLSFSGGLAHWRMDEPLEAALRRADTAMYEAKATGRALIVVADVDAAADQDR